MLELNGSAVPIATGTLSGGGFSGLTFTSNGSLEFNGTGTSLSPLEINSSSVTMQGNAFNSGNNLVQLIGGALPAVSGANLTSLNASALASGEVPTAVLPSTVAYTNQSNLFVSSQTIAAAGFSVGGSTFAVTNGEVGIGTANPQANLDVSGPLGADVRINVSGGVAEIEAGGSILAKLKP